MQNNNVQSGTNSKLLFSSLGLTIQNADCATPPENIFNYASSGTFSRTYTHRNVGRRVRVLPSGLEVECLCRENFGAASEKCVPIFHGMEFFRSDTHANFQMRRKHIKHALFWRSFYIFWSNLIFIYR